MILDTCHRRADRRPDRQARHAEPDSLVGEDKDRTGLHILAGCAADAGSYEASRYGQGVLTYSLLFGMRGGSLKEDQFVDVSTLFKFSAQQGAEVGLGIGGIQRPVIASPKGDTFEIGQVRPTTQPKIPLQPSGRSCCAPTSTTRTISIR